jgi:hypothetical protein
MEQPTLDNEQIIRKACQIAEDKDSEGWLAAFLITNQRHAP